MSCTLNFSENAIMAPSISSRWLRDNAITEIACPVDESTVVVRSEEQSAEVILFDVKEVIRAKLEHSGWGNRVINTIPSYAQQLKAQFGNGIVTGYFDSPAYKELLQTVPFDQRPPIVFGLYADALDRDAGIHSSSKHQIHCTYIQVLNVREFGLRKRTDYELVMLINEKSMKTCSYDVCQQKLISSIVDLVNSGLEIGGKLHAVRLSYLQVSGQTFFIV